MHKHGDVRTAVAQGREVDGHHIQTEIQILSKGPRAIGGFQVTIGRRDHAHINRRALIAPHRPYFFFLQHPKQFCLHLQGQLADLVEKDCSPIGRLKQTRFRFRGPGKSAFFVSEKLALH